jgi:hypothetical protein
MCVQNVLPKHNHFQIDEALQKCGGDPTKAISYLSSRVPPNISNDKFEWFRFFDPFQRGLNKEDVALALELTFGNGLHTTIDFLSSLSNIWGNFVPPGIRISGEVFAEEDGLGDAIVDYITPIYVTLDALYPCFHPSIPRQRVHDVLVSSNGDKDIALQRLQKEYPLNRFSPVQAPMHGQAIAAHVTYPPCATAATQPAASHHFIQHGTVIGTPYAGYYGSGTGSGAVTATVSYPPAAVPSARPATAAAAAYVSYTAPTPPPSPYAYAYTPSAPAPMKVSTATHISPPPNPPAYSTGPSPHSGYRPPANLHPPVPAPPLAPVHPRPSRAPIRRALLIGINYTGTAGELRGCRNDTVEIRSLLTEIFHWPDSPQSIRVLTDDPSSPKDLQPTKRNIMAGLEWLSEGLLPGDALFFHYSGHGSQQEDPSGVEEDGMNETIVPGETDLLFVCVTSTACLSITFIANRTS